jgi:hypothetical protein
MNKIVTDSAGWLSSAQTFLSGTRLFSLVGVPGQV